MKPCLAAALASLAVICAVGAQAAHPALDACGGLSANRQEGVEDARLFPRRKERIIEHFLKEANALPGVSIAVVKGDRVIYARGFGFRDLDGCKKAASDTRYYLKSTTKNFLGAAVAVLHEEGAIELDAPISDYLPDLKFPEGLRPEQTSIRAHLTHLQPYFDAGLNYRTAFPGNLPEEDYIAHVNAFSEAKDIRFLYSNFGPIMAAHAVGAKTGTNWRDFIREKVFEPAGMTNSFTVMAEAEKGPMAQGYVGGFEAAFKPALTKIDSQMHAAGGASSTAADLARWVIINLNDGRVDGKQALPQRAIEQAHARHAQLDADFSEYHRFAYGLGIYSADYEGDLLMHHFGGETHMSFMPDRGLGVVVLTNELDIGVRVTHALASTIYDILLGKKDIDARVERRLAAIKDAKAEIATRLDQYLAQVRERAPNAPPVYSADDLVGDYVDPRLGEISVMHDGEGLKVVFGAITGSLDHLGGDAWLADIGLWNDMPPQVFVFREDEKHGLVLDWGSRIFARQ